MSKRQIGYLVLLPAAIISACSVSKDIEIPKDAFPAQYRNALPVSDTANFAAFSARNLFTDPQLRRLIDSAIARNYDMLIAMKSIEASRLLFGQVKWDYLPQVDFNLSANRQRPSDNSLTGLSLATYNIQSKHIDDYTASLSMSWEADIWGKIHSRNKEALAVYLRSIEARKALQTSLVADVAQGYFIC